MYTYTMYITAYLPSWLISVRLILILNFMTNCVDRNSLLVYRQQVIELLDHRSPDAGLSYVEEAKPWISLWTDWSLLFSTLCFWFVPPFSNCPIRWIWSSSSQSIRFLHNVSSGDSLQISASLAWPLLDRGMNMGVAKDINMNIRGEGKHKRGQQQDAHWCRVVKIIDHAQDDSIEKERHCVRGHASHHLVIDCLVNN